MALGYCQRHAPDCRIALNFNRSLAACRAAGGKPCTLAVSVCSVK